MPFAILIFSFLSFPIVFKITFNETAKNQEGERWENNGIKLKQKQISFSEIELRR